jgi:hypothetical protein
MNADQPGRRSGTHGITPIIERTRRETPSPPPAHPRRVDALTLAVAAGAATAALAGLLVDGLYTSGRSGIGADATAAMLRADDLVTLMVALPALLWATTGTRRTTMVARLVAAASLAYLGYTYAYYVLGNGFTDLLLLHVAVLAGSMVALIRILPDLGSGVAVGSRRSARGAGATLGVLATALGGMWISVCSAYVATGRMPEGSLLVETDQVVQLGIVLDLTVLVPLYGAAAWLLWRGRSAGVVLGAIALVAGLMHQLGYLAALLFQELAGVPGAVGFDPFEPVIVATYVTGSVLLLRTLPRVESVSARDEGRNGGST